MMSATTLLSLALVGVHPAHSFQTKKGMTQAVFVETSGGPAKPWKQDHHWRRPQWSVHWNDHLFVFLGGAGNTPDQFDKILETAAQAGHHAVALSYNTVGLSSALQKECQAEKDNIHTCSDDDQHCNVDGDCVTPGATCDLVLQCATDGASCLTDADCGGNQPCIPVQEGLTYASECYREGRHRAAYCTESVWDEHYTAPARFYDVECGDDVSSRIASFLADIITEDPGGDWPSFDDGPLGYDPSKIVLAGFSGGAGISWYMSTEDAFHAVIMLDGVADTFDVVQQCAGGTNPGDSCAAASDCQGGTCEPVSAVLAPLDAGATCGDDYFVFNHNNNQTNPDPSVDRPTQMRAQWDHLGVPAVPSAGGADTRNQSNDLASHAGPLANRRFRITDTCDDQGDAHGSVAYDDELNQDSSEPCAKSPTATTNYYLFEAYKAVFSRAATHGGSCP